MIKLKNGIYTNELFKVYCNKDLTVAQVIAKNLFCKNPSDPILFDSYFSFCSETITKNTNLSIEECQFFLSEAELALRIFSEKSVLDENSLSIIRKSYDTINKKALIIQSFIEEQQNALELSEKSRNDKVFSELCSLIGELKKNYEEKILEDISELDNKLNKELLSKTQHRTYNTLSEDLSKMITKRQKDAHILYNRNALEDYKAALDKFIKDSDYKKDMSKLKILLLKLFYYKQEQLFPETLAYYNYVYQYIFGKLDNDGKKYMTECAITSKN